MSVLVTTVRVGERLQLFQVPTSAEEVKFYFGVPEDVGKLVCKDGKEVTELGHNGPYTLDVNLLLVAKNKRFVGIVPATS